MHARRRGLQVSALALLALVLYPGLLAAKTSTAARQALVKLLLGKEVKALIPLPATKEGVDVYHAPARGKFLDERGIDMRRLTKWLKSKGVGVDQGQWAMITNVKVDARRVEVHLGGGGEGRRGSRHANKTNPSYLRAGGSRVNFVYRNDVIDSDLDPQTFLAFMSRVLDVSRIRAELAEKSMPAEFQQAIAEKTVREGMTYQMVQLAFGDPEEKKLGGASGGSFSETWYYMRQGRRWVIKFVNGKVVKAEVF